MKKYIFLSVLPVLFLSFLTLSFSEEKGDSYNCQHPELREGEVFLLNCSYSDDEDGCFGDIGYKTKRIGNTAYSRSGEEMSDAFPVFVEKQEVEAAGIKLECME